MYNAHVQVNVDIRNVSGSSRQMRIIPLNSPYFTVTRGWPCLLSTFLPTILLPSFHSSVLLSRCEH